MEPNSFSTSRRALLKSGTIAGLALGLSGVATPTANAASSTGDAPEPGPNNGGPMIDVPFERHEEVRLGIVGLGSRGMGMLRTFLTVPHARITAICDIRPERTQQAVQYVLAAGQPPPAVYNGGKGDYESAVATSQQIKAITPDPKADDFRGLCARDDVDFVYTPTPWEWHYPVAMAAMRSGKHVGTELPLTWNLQWLWELVDTSETTRRHCIQMENVSYGQNELRLLRMAHAGVFGDLLHGAGAYIDDIRYEYMGPGAYRYPPGWRRHWHTRANACLYPNHGLAPIAADMDINRGDRFVRLVSSASPALGLAAYREQLNIPRSDPIWNEKYIKGDRNICLIETAKGRVVRLEHDTTSPAPYDRLNYLAGTKGLFRDYPPRIYLEPDMSGDEWGDFDKYAEYDHWLWKDVGGQGGHGGIDGLLAFRLVQTMRLGLVPDIDVYDSAAWSAPFPLSRESLKVGSEVDYPDFTRGHWQEYHSGLDSPRPESDEAAMSTFRSRQQSKQVPSRSTPG